MANDAMLLAVDQIRFTYLRAKKMRVYAIGIAADNTGKVLVTEPPASAAIKHKPKQNRPAVWDFGGDGYPIYQKTGGLPDIIVAHLIIARDRHGQRKAGEIIKAVGASSAVKSAIKDASTALGNLSIGGFAAASALGLVLPIAQLVGEIVSEQRDKVLQTISGSLFLDEDRKHEDVLTDTIRSPDNNMEVEVDAFLFDAAADADSKADTRSAETRLHAEGLLFTEKDAR
jgi:hypothetical protein